MKHLTSLLLLSGIFALGSPSSLHAAPVSVDSFSYQVIPSGTFSAPSGNMVGGEADITVSSELIGDVSIGGGELELNDAGGNSTLIRLTYDGVDGANSDNHGLSVDLTGGGMNDRIRLNFLSVTGSVSYILTIHTNAGNFITKPSTVVSSAGTSEAIFAQMGATGNGADLTNVTQIEILFHNIHMGEGFRLGPIAATGEAIVSPDDNLVALQKISRKIKKLRRKMKKARKKGQREKVQRLRKKLRKLKKRKRRL